MFVQAVELEEGNQRTEPEVAPEPTADDLSTDADDNKQDDGVGHNVIGQVLHGDPTDEKQDEAGRRQSIPGRINEFVEEEKQNEAGRPSLRGRTNSDDNHHQL